MAVRRTGARPRIAITGPARRAKAPRGLVAGLIWRYGGAPVQVRPGDATDATAFDAVVITGGHDVDPVLYAAEPPGPVDERRYDAERDALESALIRHALATERPLLAICRGAQLLNVCRGGTLHQSLHDLRVRTSHRWTVLPLKTARVEPGTLLSGLTGAGALRVNSLHDQAIDRLGEGLEVSARDEDGLVQGIEDPALPFAIGVQWHPEFLPYLAAQRALFRALVQKAEAQRAHAG